MGCACNSGKKTATASTYVVTAADGSRKTYRTEVEAIAAAKRTGGTWKKQ